MTTFLSLLAFPVGLAVGTYLGLLYWHGAIAVGYDGPSRMRPVNQRPGFRITGGDID